MTFCPACVFLHIVHDCTAAIENTAPRAAKQLARPCPVQKGREGPWEALGAIPRPHEWYDSHVSKECVCGPLYAFYGQLAEYNT